MIIALTGIMGSGKSSVGRELRALLSCSFIDLDEYIEKVSGRSINSIFAEDGEDAFRTTEADCLREIIDTHHNTDILVLALGGGTVTNPDCAELVHDRTFCIFLTATPETVAERLISETDRRPLLHGARNTAEIAERISALLSQRENSYLAASHCKVATDSLTPGRIALHIIQKHR